jgi:hypothetical protein
VVHVGEWGGLTADATFEAELRRTFEQPPDAETERARGGGRGGAVVCCPLPSWGTDAASLTVWRRKPSEQPAASYNNGSSTTNNGSSSSSSSGTGQASFLVPCAACGAKATVRCRFARRLALCGAAACPGSASAPRSSDAQATALAPAAKAAERRCAAELAMQMLRAPSHGQGVLSVHCADHFARLDQSN